MVLHKHVRGVDTIFSTMEGPLVTNPLEKYLGVTRRGTYQVGVKYIRWEYEQVSDLWTYVDIFSDPRGCGSSDERGKDKDNMDDQ